MTVKVLSNQTFYDISIQYFGTADYAFAIANANQKSITATLLANDELLLPDLQTDKITIQYFKSIDWTPASALSSTTELVTLDSMSSNVIYKVKSDKPNEVKPLSKQSFYDISIQYFGTADYAFLIALKNNKSVSSFLNITDVLSLPILDYDNKVLQYFKARDVVPATGIMKNKTKINYEFPLGEFPISF